MWRRVLVDRFLISLNMRTGRYNIRKLPSTIRLLGGEEQATPAKWTRELVVTGGLGGYSCDSFECLLSDC